MVVALLPMRKINLLYPTNTLLTYTTNTHKNYSYLCHVACLPSFFLLCEYNLLLTKLKSLKAVNCTLRSFICTDCFGSLVFLRLFDQVRVRKAALSFWIYVPLLRPQCDGRSITRTAQGLFFVFDELGGE